MPLEFALRTFTSLLIGTERDITLDRAAQTKATKAGVARRRGASASSSIACFSNTGPANPAACSGLPNQSYNLLQVRKQHIKASTNTEPTPYSKLSSFSFTL